MHRLHFFYLLILLQPVTTRAQLIFQNIKQQDGLSEKQITCLYKDSEGFLWIGTPNGLNRFDGAVIRQYPNNGGPKNLSITTILPVKNKKYLLIGTHTGIRLFNKATGDFSKPRQFKIIDNEHIELIRTDEHKRFWIATTSKVFIYQEGTLYPGEMLIPSLSVVQNPEFYFSGFLWDKKRKGFWVGGQKTYFINCLNNEVYYKEKNPHQYPVLDNGNIEAIALDRNFNVWYGCNNDLTLRYWDHQRNTIESFENLSGKKVNDGYNRLFIDSKDRLWISTWSFAAYIKEPGKAITKIPYSQVQNYSIAYGHFRDAIQDNEGNIWLGTINGVSKIQENSPIREIIQVPSFDFFLETGFAQSNSIHVDNDLIMCAKEEGVLAFNSRTGQYKRYTVTNDPKELIRNRFICAAKVGSQWWFSGADGVYYLDKKRDRLVRFEQIKKKHPIRFANFVLADNRGNVWFHILNDALYRYNPTTKICSRFDGTDANHGLFNYRRLQTFLNLRNGDLLFGMNQAGLLKFDAENEQFSVIQVDDPKNFYLMSMAEDDKNNVWVAPYGKGLVKLDQQGKTLDSINITNGLLLNQINAIGIDGQGAIWASSREGLAFIDPVEKKETRVQLEIGKTLEDYWNYLTVSKGKVYAVMLDHIVVIDPFRFETIAVKKPPHITSVKIFQNEKINASPDQELHLKADEDYVSFQYASLNHREIPSLLYSYQLEGVDQQWVNAGRTLSASYNNLAHGHYTFHVRSTDEHGRWMKTTTRLKFFVEPDWWQTWWAYLTYLALLVVSLVVAYKGYKKRKQKKVVEETIDYFANSVYGENSVAEICWDIARNCISQLHFEDCVVYLLDRDRGVLVQKAAYGPKNPKGHEISNPIEIALGEGIVGSVAVTGKALIIHDTSGDPRYIVDDEVRLSEIAVPILHEGKVIGVIDSEHRKKNFYKDEHLKALSTIASISANKIAEALAQAQAQEKEMKLLEIRKMLAESQLMALRAQMNPHFVFNCLNSIQECIVTKKYSEASKYLNKFSRLFRMVLNNSGRNLVTIQEELEVLELYLQLERMRFEKSFSYQIIIDEALETDEILLPSMLVQPYVENALWHGLMHSTAKRELLIEFRLVDDDILECRIEDNGIGRKKSFELKKQNSKTKRHESKGLLISKERLDVLQRQGQHAEVHMTDKYNDDGVGVGTLVVIELSAFLKKD
jgi:ligand-binding sensor domain-containing protein/putative methionine-R-sulfoxide reductase with GAF domain